MVVIRKGIAMSDCHRTLLWSFALIACSVLPGCNQRLLQERDALFAENQGLSEQLTSARAELAAERGHTANLQAQLDSSRLSSKPTMSLEETGFSDIAGIDVIQGAGTLTVRVPGDILFSSGRVNLKNSAQNTLSQIAGVLQSQYTHNTVRIAGHTDTDPIKKSGWKDNLELSLQRAAAVQRYLKTQGINATRMYSAGYGATRPAASKVKSRRVEIVVALQE